MKTGRIIKVSGPLVVAGMSDKMYDVVRVSESRLIGEIIEIRMTGVHPGLRRDRRLKSQGACHDRETFERRT